MSKRSNKLDRYRRKQELRIIRMLVRSKRNSKNRPLPPRPSYIPPDLVWATEDCEVCGNQTLYHMQYDWIFCPWCNEGKESVCDDTDCIFCRNRPEQPLTVIEWEQWKRGELNARTIDPSEKKVKRRRLKTNRKKRNRPVEKRGLKFRDPNWYVWHRWYRSKRDKQSEK